MAAFTLPGAGLFRAPLGFDIFWARTGVFLTATEARLLACAFGARAAFLGGFAVLARAASALGREAFFVCAFGFAGFFETFFLGELAIISVSPLVSRAQAEAYLRAFSQWRKKRFTREKTSKSRLGARS
jgi:hypothetical protein